MRKQSTKKKPLLPAEYTAELFAVGVEKISLKEQVHRYHGSMYHGDGKASGAKFLRKQ